VNCKPERASLDLRLTRLFPGESMNARSATSGSLLLLADGGDHQAQNHQNNPARGHPRIESFKLEIRLPLIRLPLIGVLQSSATVTAARQLHDFDGLGEAWIARRFDGLMRIHCPPSSTRTWFSAER
jgi:hypothetical protein